MSQLRNYLEVARETARKAGEVLLDWAGRAQVREKGTADFVTEADTAAQDAIQQAILTRFPTHGFLGEENLSIASQADGLTWVVDPLDGTTNYVHGIPHYAVSIALVQHGEPLLGVVYDPKGDECFAAARGEGAWLNDQPIKTSRQTRLRDAVVALSFPPGMKSDAQELRDFLRVVVLAQSMRRSGSAALNLSYIAAGRFDAYWSLSSKPWDVAAGFVLVAEAGGSVIERFGGAIRFDSGKFIAASSPELVAELRALLDAP